MSRLDLSTRLNTKEQDFATGRIQTELKVSVNRNLPVYKTVLLTIYLQNVHEKQSQRKQASFSLRAVRGTEPTSNSLLTKHRACLRLSELYYNRKTTLFQNTIRTVNIAFGTNSGINDVSKNETSSKLSWRI